jgi:hypothetical protein
MHKSVSFLVLVALLGFAAPVSAQQQAEDEDPEIVISYYRCPTSVLDDWEEALETRSLPIYQQLVDEGKIMNWGSLRHEWAGYENMILWSSGADIPSLLAANEEFQDRMQAAHPDAEPAGCRTHRDAFYWIGPNTGPTPMEAETAVVSSFTCDIAGQDGLQVIADAIEEQWLPVWNELVDQGHWTGAGALFHDWAGTENVLIYRNAKDKMSFFAGTDEEDRLLEERYGENADGPLANCTHRDAIYTIGPRTYGPSGN